MMWALQKKASGTDKIKKESITANVSIDDAGFMRETGFLHLDLK